MVCCLHLWRLFFGGIAMLYALGGVLRCDTIIGDMRWPLHSVLWIWLNLAALFHTASYVPKTFSLLNTYMGFMVEEKGTHISLLPSNLQHLLYEVLFSIPPYPTSRPPAPQPPPIAVSKAPSSPRTSCTSPVHA